MSNKEIETKTRIFKIITKEEEENLKLKTKQYWTKDQDSQLLDLVENEKKIGKTIRWKNIAQCLNMDYTKCYSRYRQINPKINKGYWSKEEDKKLKELVNIHGRKWAKISRILVTRSGKQIRHHYINITDNQNNKLKFTEDERIKLMELHKIHGSNWQQISSFFTGRTADNLKCKFYNFTKERKGENTENKESKCNLNLPSSLKFKQIVTSNSTNTKLTNNNNNFKTTASDSLINPN